MTRANAITFENPDPFQELRSPALTKAINSEADGEVTIKVEEVAPEERAGERDGEQLIRGGYCGGEASLRHLLDFCL
jgi:hypothetical protein